MRNLVCERRARIGRGNTNRKNCYCNDLKRLDAAGFLCSIRRYLHGDAAREKIVMSSDTPTYMTINRDTTLTRPFMTMPAVAFPLPPGRLSAMKPRITPIIASGMAHADASTVTRPATLIMPSTIEAMASLLLGG